MWDFILLILLVEFMIKDNFMRSAHNFAIGLFKSSYIKRGYLGIANVKTYKYSWNMSYNVISCNI